MTVKSIRKNRYDSGVYDVTLDNGAGVEIMADSPRVVRELLKASKAHQEKLQTAWDYKAQFDAGDRKWTSLSVPSTEGNGFARKALVQNVRLMVEKMIGDGWDVKTAAFAGNAMLQGATVEHAYDVDQRLAKDIRANQRTLVLG